MTTGQPRWTKQDNGVTTTLQLTCMPDDHVHMQSLDGDFSGEYNSIQEAQGAFLTLAEQGIGQAKQEGGGTSSS